ncbi:MAG: excinuclease ABC subunit C [Legionellales bacterium RIFCSPHIGHO2_12_FULL_42_9]|nr:MAG: excinuclease ABC subunit C [Legionellales bacterium RIFCSPHIGHO2_12_FULL_42_9]
MNQIPDYLTDFLSQLTSEPGVYRMLDAEGIVLYVGKAKNLKKRVTSYFAKQTTGAKTRKLVKQIATIDVSVTRSETEALLLESNLIKTLHPKYNVLLRDDKSYPYIRVTGSHPFPRMELIRCKKKPSDKDFFGPYPTIGAVKDTLNTIQKVFKIRNCRDSYFNSRTRPCLQYEINRCTAPCTAYISKADYQQTVQDAVRFLQGKSQQIIADLEVRMEEAALHLAFEEAALLRDQIKSLRLVQERQGVVQLRGDADVIAIESKPGFACIQWVSIREGQVIAAQHFFPAVPTSIVEDDSLKNSLLQQVLEAFIAFFYVDSPERIPALILLDKEITELPILAELLSQLRGKICRLQTNPRGNNARWLDFAHNNLRLAVKEYWHSRQSIQEKYEALHELLALENPILHMECFDISHTQGEATVASCVVFDSLGPSRSNYRRFNISGITAGDDYAAMEQALRRRYKRLKSEEKNLPNILIIDGGKGQVTIAKQVLEELDIHTISIIGIAKGPDRKAGFEHLILVAQNREITLPSDSKALHLLQHIRDEAHRFAISTHRQKRHKTRFESSLELIEGVGPKRRQALLRRFGGVPELTKAPIEEIAKVTGISQELAQRIFNYFHPDWTLNKTT